jgi:copper chaperone CopZ
MKTRFFCTLTLIFVLTCISAVSAFAQTSTEQSQPAQNSAVQKIKLKVSGITCSGDCKDIEKAVGKINGVSTVKMLSKPSATSVFEVSFNPAVVTEKEIRKAVEATPGCENPNDRPYKVKQG